MTREDAIKELEILKEDYWEDDGYGHETKQYGNTMLALDMAIKALDQEPKIGHWNEIPKYADIAWLCSECGHFTTMKHNYCPKCGCRMVESQESEG